MADLYCNHGAYARMATAFTGHIHSTTSTTYTGSGGTNLVITAITGGVGVGSCIQGGNSAGQAVVITAQQSGTPGGVGVYTVSGIMNFPPATNYTATYGAPFPTGDDPTWGVAQEGDGLASGTPTPATVSISLSALTAAAGDTLTIAGATLTCVASGATNNQFNAGSGATLVSNLVTAINRTTNTVTRTATGVLTGWSTPKIQDAFFARIGSPTTTLDIMTRAGSATFNSTNDHRVVGSGGLSTINAQFTGGASGEWGWLWNPAGTIWPSAMAENSYGVVFSGAAYKPLAGPTLTVNDVVNLKATGVGITQCCLGSKSVTFTANLNFRLDDGTIWNGANGTFTINGFASTGHSFTIISSVHTTIYSKTKDAFIFTVSGLIGVCQFCSSTTSSLLQLERCLIVDIASGAAYFLIFINGAHNRLTFIDCHFKSLKTTWVTWLNATGANTNQQWRAINCTFEWTAYAAAAGVLCNIYTNDGDFFFSGCEAIGATPRIASTTTPANRFQFTAQNMKGFDIGTTLVGLLGVASVASGLAEPNYVLLQNIGNNRAFRLEVATAVVDWNPSDSYPTYNAALPNGTAWSYRIKLSNSQDSLRKGNWTRLLQLTKTHTATSGVKVVTVETLVPSTQAASIMVDHLPLIVSYVDSNDIMRSERTSADLQYPSSVAIASSGATWSTTTYGGSSYVARKLTLTTAYPVKQNTEVEVSLIGFRAMPALMDIFVNPEIGLDAP